jgi:hypothetical protein
MIFDRKFDQLKACLKKPHSKQLRDYSLLLVPLNVKDEHLILIAVHLESQTMYFLDPSQELDASLDFILPQLEEFFTRVCKDEGVV